MVKYLGTSYNEERKKWEPRSKFLINGMFRVTQPKFLNDKGSESKCVPYFNEFSPTDIAWAKSEFLKQQKIKNEPFPPENDLIKFYLEPCGIRYGEAFPHMLMKNTEFNNIEEYDKATFLKSVEDLHSFFIETLSSQLGVFSLAKSEVNELMWTHYGNEGKGLAISFDENNSFFKKFPPKNVDYDPEKRATFTYYKGMLRLNGYPLESYRLHEGGSILNHFLSNQRMIVDFADRLLYSKSKKWAYEEETRIIVPLSMCDEYSGKIHTPPTYEGVPTSLSKLFTNYHEYSLKKIPFDAFESIYLGYAMNDEDKEYIISLLKSNSELSHVRINQAKINIHGEIETYELIA